MSDYIEEVDQEQRVKDEMDQEEMEISDIRDILSRPSGLRFFERMVRNSMVHSKGLMTGNSHTYYNLGKRDTVLRYLELLVKADSVKFAQIFLSTTED